MAAFLANVLAGTARAGTVTVMRVIRSAIVICKRMMKERKKAGDHEFEHKKRSSNSWL